MPAKSAKSPKTECLLVELLTEELPPKSLKRLSIAFADAVVENLKDKDFIDHNDFEVFATPRRLAVAVPRVLSKQLDRAVERKGPSLQSGLDAAGQPTQALLGFARSCGVESMKLERRTDATAEYFFHRTNKKGETLKQHLADIVQDASKRIPAPKIMRWGAGTAQFVRPVHGVVLLLGSKIVPGTVFGLKSGNRTLGHRFMAKGAIVIKRAAGYEAILLTQGKVIASFEKRRDLIVKELDKAAAKLGKGANWRLGQHRELIEEVTSIVESPSVHAGDFNKRFLEVPRECLIVSMQHHQKYFPVADAHGALLPKFLFVANIRPVNGSQIIHGNERVLHARLSDAKFFYDLDRATTLAERVPRLGNIVYHNKLGSQLERVERLVKLAGRFADLLGADFTAAERAAHLCKADLLTGMVGEFPELQGVMGRYYARHDGEAPEVADAIEQHYFPRAAGADLPRQSVAICVALADKLDTLAGLFGTGQKPTGDKDPFGLRRAALGAIRIIIENRLSISSNDVVRISCEAQPPGAGNAENELQEFLAERLRGYLRDSGHSAQEIDTVLSTGISTNLAEVPAVLEAVKTFQRLPEAADLAAANKRIVNIIKKSGVEKTGADVGAMVEPAERALFEALQGVKPEIESKFKTRDYSGALQALARLKKPVDDFFDGVMVMVDDPQVRANRLALLGDLKEIMNRVADISKLAA
jgi:glycyl-tRNA synthetase beta chain